MSAVLLDTTVASLLHPRKMRSAAWRLYEPHVKGQILTVCFQTVAEMYAWAELNQWGPEPRAALEAVLHRFVVIPYTADLARAWAQAYARAMDQGVRLESGDAWICASAVRYRLPLITHDKDFTRLHLPGLEVVCFA